MDWTILTHVTCNRPKWTPHEMTAKPLKNLFFYSNWWTWLLHNCTSNPTTQHHQMDVLPLLLDDPFQGLLAKLHTQLWMPHHSRLHIDRAILILQCSVLLFIQWCHTNKTNKNRYLLLWPTDFSLTSVKFYTKKIAKIVNLFLGILIYYVILYQIKLHH